MRFYTYLLLPTYTLVVDDLNDSSQLSVMSTALNEDDASDFNESP